MELWQRRGVTFGERSSLLKRNEALADITTDSLAFFEGLQGPILDVGCGDGIPTIALAQHHRVIGVDFASTMLQRAKRALSSTDFLIASIDHLPLQNSSVPAASCYFVLSDYGKRTPLLVELQRILCARGKLAVADYSSNDEFNNLLDDLQKKVLGRDRGMFRLDPKALTSEVEKAGFRVESSKEICYSLRTGFETFIDQLYLSSTGAEYRKKQLSEGQWKELLSEWLEGREISLTRRFVLVLSEKPYQEDL